ncbi:MAG: chromosome partition protein MukB [Polyangiaceae bacterium]|jgi:chromosome partition protein MukB|nr:chromosome partition protein MukB [Polyangiaceae bacterium]MBK8942476.1 chromosome partition protein MukB [Polyangiaceae bacterium]
MTRARATALALVNWKGVFYERYLLDRHVTVLEGANGAGKTTVMIAAYVALLPDMSRLRFTNLGESGATGGDRGIWGRLGEPGRPSYTALEIEHGGERVVAGVRLERKAEPTVELTPFLISGVDLRGQLRDVLLVSRGEDDEVPDLSDLRRSVSARGGELTVFASAKEYFAALFERGITPLRLATDEDRNKLNEMLRTSMTGGISRALTTELRGFLLKEETGLADTLARMRKNLDACHRTRTEVVESQGLERELAGVLDAGRAMFLAALGAAREAAREVGAAVEAARAARDVAEGAAREIEVAASEVAARQSALVGRLAAKRLLRDEARAKRAKLAHAQRLKERLEEREPAAAAAEARADEGLAARERAAHERASARARRDEARAAYDRAARGVGDLQAGLDELHRTLHARRLAARRLAEVRALLEDPSFDEPSIDTALPRARAQLAQLDAARAQASRAAVATEGRRARYGRAIEALALLDPGSQGSDAHERAERAEARLLELEALSKRAEELPSELDEHSQLALRQAEVRTRAAEVGLDPSVVGPPTSAAKRVAEALALAESEARRAEAELGEAERGVEADRVAALSARATAQELEATALDWIACQERARELERALGQRVSTREAAIDARVRLAEQVEQQRARAGDLRAKHEERLREAGELDASGGAFHPELLRLRDRLDAELLAGRFEDVDPAEAGRLEAELGPLAQALIVNDPAAAARALAGQPRELEEVWLVSPEAALPTRSHEPAPTGDDLIVELPHATRLVRLPARPSLGRLARARRAKELRTLADELAREADAALASLYELEGLTRTADELLARADLLHAEDPRLAAARARSGALELDERRAAHAERAARARDSLSRARAKGATLRDVLGEAYLLDPPDHAQLADQARRALSAARAAREELRRCDEPRRVLRELREELRHRPATDEEAASSAAAQAALDAERDRVFSLIEALEDLAEHRGALVGADDERALEERAALAPRLHAQLDGARSALAEAEAAVARAEAAWEESTAAWQRESATAHSARALVVDLKRELASLGLDELDLDAPDDGARAAADLERAVTSLEAEERELVTTLAQLGERASHAQRALLGAQARLQEEERAAEPLRVACRQVEAEAAERGLLKGGIEEHAGGGARARAADAHTRAQVLVERLRRARGGAECAEEIERTLTPAATPDRRREAVVPPLSYLSAWITARAWLAKRLPGQIADVDDPIEALARLRDHLSVLERRLSSQESDLRGASEDVARGIDVRLRKARSQVRRLNQTLTGVRFGSIAGIRVEMRRVERMEAVLRALRDGSAQELLFLSTLPIEEALDEIFRRYGGGRGGGQRLLDYREYAELAVEIQRGPDKDWELASPTRLSTGEAIGVGAALMMVILTEWERDSHLLRPRAASGSLRFLFLDEANRLSQDNLGVLFAMCQGLDLQLLIAAPEVARAEGNTTYRLVRRVGDDGAEEVVVSGRRVAS